MLKSNESRSTRGCVVRNTANGVRAVNLSYRLRRGGIRF